MLEELKSKLAEEIERLTHELQVTLPRAIQKAVEHGDLRENSEYKSALERQQFVQARLNHLTKRAAELSKIDLSQVPADRVGFGSKVTVVDTRTKEKETYTLVFGDFIDVDSNQISLASPLGQALMGKQVGETVLSRVELNAAVPNDTFTLPAPEGYEVQTRTLVEAAPPPPTGG